MSLHKIVRAGYYDFKKSEKLWDNFDKHKDHGVSFYGMDIIIDKYEYALPGVDGKKHYHKSGFLPMTFDLAATHKVGYFDFSGTCARYHIFQRGPHDLRTAVWRKTADSVICFDPDFDEPEDSAYKKIMKRIKLGEFSR